MHRLRSTRFLLVLTALALLTASCADTATTTTEAAATTTTTAAATTTTTAAAEETTTTGAPEAKGVIGFSYGNESSGIYPIVALPAAIEAERLGYEFVEGSANGDCDKQVQDIEGMIAQGVDGLVFLPLCGPEPYATVVADAKAAGIVVVGYSTAIPGADAAIVYDNVSGGELIARDAIRWFNEEFTGDKASFTWALFTYDQCGRACTERTDTIRSVIVAELGIEPLEAEAVAEDTGLEATETFLQGTPTLNMLIGINDGGALGGYQAFVNQIESEGRDPGEIYVGGMDGQNEALALIAEGGGPHGIYRASAALILDQLGKAVADLPINIIEGQPTNSLLLNYELVTPADPDRAQEILDNYASFTS
jgi:ribose transport system substrate-binding protein